jgi:hypothetical protein
MHNMVSYCGQLADNLRISRESYTTVMHATHRNEFLSSEKTDLYSFLSTSCTQLTHSTFSFLTEVINGLYPLSTGPITTTKYIKEYL